MLLSIIVPVFNGEKRIERCLESLTTVKESDVEFIIVNDGSTDGTKSICETYVKRDARFQLINQENGGVSKARNTGLDFSQGKYISFVDADDELTADYNDIIEIIKEVTSTLFGFDSYIQTEKELTRRKRVFFTPGENDRKVLYSNFLTENSNSIWNNIYQLRIIQENGIHFPEEMNMGEDCVFNAQYFRYCHGIYYIDKVGYKYYYDNKSSSSHANKISYLNDFAKIYENLLQIHNSCDDLDFPFGGKYYIQNVFRILRYDRENMSKLQKRAFRKSEFYNALMNFKCNDWKLKIKKWLIRVFIFLP